MQANESERKIEKLRGIIELYLENEKRNNPLKPSKYWYPLSLATYGVEEIIEALDSMCSFATSMHHKTAAFEQGFSDYQGSADSVMVNSGSSADLLLTFLLSNPYNPLCAPGSEVLVPVVTWPTHIWSIKMAGFTPKFVDVDPKTLNIDLKDLERKIGPNTSAIFLVHLMGNPCQMDVILDLAKKHNLVIIEDCCEALGAKWDGKSVGNFGLGGSFSFFFSHHMMTMEGGMICSASKDIGEQLRILRAHGWIRNVEPTNFKHLLTPDIDPRYAFVNWGFNLRPTEVQAGFGIHQLEKLPAFNQKREALAQMFFGYINALSEFVSVPKVHPKAEPSWFSFPLMVNESAPFTRTEILNYLESSGIETRPVVAGNIARHPVTRLFPEFSAGSYPGADKVHQNGFYIGLSPLFTSEHIARLIGVFDDFFKRYRGTKAATNVVEISS